VSSPEFVGALALFEQKLGRNHRVGNVNYFLYAKCHGSAYTGQSVIGVIRPPEAVRLARCCRHKPATSLSA